MFAATKRIYNTLKNEGGLKVFTDESDKQSDAWVQFGLKNGGSYRIRFISTDNDNDVAVRIFQLVQLEQSQVANVLPVLNQLNCQYRFTKFCCDKDGDVNVEYDYPAKSDMPERSAVEIVARFVKIVEEAYPQIMRALWS